MSNVEQWCHVGINLASNPLLDVADAHGVEFPEPCLLYNIRIATWKLSPGELSLPAPPQDAFGVLTSASTYSDGAAAARRLLSGTITSTLVVNDEEVASHPVTYDPNAGPQLLSVTPTVISAAMPEVCISLRTACSHVLCFQVELALSAPALVHSHFVLWLRRHMKPAGN